MTEDGVLSRLFAVPGPAFAAKYPGTCKKCGRRFPVGERIRYIAKKKLAHDKCANPGGFIHDDVLGDAMARRKMRSHKPSTWRLGKSPSDYG